MAHLARAGNPQNSLRSLRFAGNWCWSLSSSNFFSSLETSAAGHLNKLLDIRRFIYHPLHSLSQKTNMPSKLLSILASLLAVNSMVGAVVLMQAGNRYQSSGIASITATEKLRSRSSSEHRPVGKYSNPSSNLQLGQGKSSWREKRKLSVRSPFFLDSAEAFNSGVNFISSLSSDDTQKKQATNAKNKASSHVQEAKSTDKELEARDLYEIEDIDYRDLYGMDDNIKLGAYFGMNDFGARKWYDVDSSRRPDSDDFETRIYYDTPVRVEEIEIEREWDEPVEIRKIGHYYRY
ncbi:hypothetical protein AMATHDRAFT_88926 [Amanita thiersii Skay4041]|uniref:Uncharacterized protein n=1 Tax=Amanita thiersii Skay4041 TaxID=703135 RepID=A0A2A9NA09_9AGAR|nr:hypothetical protein AMATHDRAFT_88926 [Amanita thiersii Skay4041]